MAATALAQRSEGTLVDLATAALREEILSGELRPGERVHLAGAAERLGMSMVPVREALRSLASEGLVIAVPQRGYRVSPISADDLADLYRVRLVLDPMATELAVPRLTDADRAELESAMAALEQAYARGDRDAHRIAHRRFHFAIYSACGSAWLLRFLELMWDASYRYQRLSARRRGSLADRAAEHRRILAACLAGDAPGAAALMREHLALTLTAVETEPES